MDYAEVSTTLLEPNDPILITGAGGFIGSAVVRNLLDRGFRNLRCLARPSSDVEKLRGIASSYGDLATVNIVRGNLLSREDCAAMTKDVAAVFHLAAARGEKSYPDAFMNSVVTTRNLLAAVADSPSLKRFVNISSFAIYSNVGKPRWRLLDEQCPVEPRSDLRGEAYCFAKAKQDEIVKEYGDKFGIPYVIVRPGYVYGPGNEAITSRVGIGTFGIFLHLGGGNTIPLTYVDNCADAIVRAGFTKGIDGEVFNVVDNELPSSRAFLRAYKRHVRRFTSIYVPHSLSYGLCWLWESYSRWSEGQLPPAFNRRSWHAYWKRTHYSNAKLKSRLGWMPKVSTTEGLARYFQSCRERGGHA
jgi:nucleoside-diphosphate-sugar epimerase